MFSKNFIFTLLLSLFVLGACNSGGSDDVPQQSQPAETESEATASIITTTFVLEDFIQTIGGENVEVTNLVPSGGDAHSFEPTAQQMIEIAEADAFVYNGAGFEGFVESVLNSLQGEGILTLEATTGISLRQGNEDEHGDETADEHEDEHGEEATDQEHVEEEHAHEDADPHAWLDPVFALQYAENIYELLLELYPEYENEFTSNYTDLKDALETLHNEFEEMVSTADRDQFIVSHAGYGYWEDRYGLEQIAISGLSPTNEPSQRQVQEVIELGESLYMDHLYVEQNFTPQVAEMIANEIGAEVLYLHNLEVRTDEDIETGANYLSLMRGNIESLKQGLNE
ncbi:metal ABC transporter solute-binding protein, Zn/Mn family [Shouchella shacheensis]|uniref:metal ABC transporter solute-binding protein, Zn/Mn family n=1 Tax=Shouchella shacheensis TaxID=1649580 RepID=UPI00073FAA24|nr:zinc ABC transporter substrate-binding protein [Shouchella shacheensis]